MNAQSPALDPQQSLGQIAATLPGAFRVFYRRDLDFCCGGKVSLEEACNEKGLAVEELIQELQREARRPGEHENRTEKSVDELIDYVLEHFHEPHRQELPRLLAMAQKVERVHSDKATCPRGLSDHLQKIIDELEEHMQKEEQVLFPMLRRGLGRGAAMPIQVMEHEHVEHGKNLERLRELANNYVAVPEACGTWKALFLGLAGFEQEIMEHIHTENNLLFPRALS